MLPVYDRVHTRGLADRQSMDKYCRSLLRFRVLSRLRHTAAASFAGHDDELDYWRVGNKWLARQGFRALTAVPLNRSYKVLSSLFSRRLFLPLWMDPSMVSLEEDHDHLHGIFKVLADAGCDRPPPARCLGTRVCHTSTSVLHPTSFSYAGLHPFSQHYHALPPITWRGVGAIPDPPPNIIACGVTASAHSEATPSETATDHRKGWKMP
jgi:hypothetical protein